MDNKRNYIKKFDKLNVFFLIGYLWNSTSHNYGSDIALNLTESHTLQYIVENPNSYITDIANAFHLTLSATSKIVTRLEKKGLIIKEKQPQNRKNIYMRATEMGLQAHHAHITHDENYYERVLDVLLEHHDIAEIDTFFNVLDSFIKYNP